MTECQIAEELERPDARSKPWFLAVDGVCTQRGGDALVESALKYRKKRRGDKGRSTKAHAFVQALLIAPSGARIPLPRRSCYTRKYVNRHNRLLKEGRRHGKPRAFKTQVDLACLIVKELDLPAEIHVVVLADEGGESAQLLCQPLPSTTDPATTPSPFPRSSHPDAAQRLSMALRPMPTGRAAHVGFGTNSLPRQRFR